MSCDIVVAQYQENIDWLKHINHSYIRNICLYTKSKQSKIFHKDTSKLNKKIIHSYLPNIGRESHTYLTYCLDYYDNLPSFIFFLQGDSAAHGFNNDTLMRWIDIVSKNNSITHTNNYSKHTIFVGLENGRRPCWAYSNCELSEYAMPEWFKIYISTEDINLHNINIYFGATFGVSDSRILSRSKQEYKTLIAKELSTINPEAGHFMERSWYYLFNLHKHDQNIY